MASNLGAKTHLRVSPDESNDVVMPDIPTISCLESIPIDIRPEFAFMVQCTSPFVKAETYRSACDTLIKNCNMTVFAAHKAHAFLWQEPSLEDIDSWTPINHPFHERIGRQFAKKLQVNELGAFYGFKTSSFIEAKHRFFSKAIPVLLCDDEVIDIDTKEDWAFAEFKLRRIYEN